MDEMNVDDMESTYAKAVLKEKKKKEKKIKKSEIDEKKILALGILLAVIIISIILAVWNRQIKKSEQIINSELVDEVKYVDASKKNGINPEEVLNKTDEKSSETETAKKDEESLNETSGDVISENKNTNKEVELKEYYAIQIGASTNLESVKREVNDMTEEGYPAYFIKEGTKQYMYKLLVDRKFETREKATAYAEELKGKGIIGDFWVRYFSE